MNRWYLINQIPGEFGSMYPGKYIQLSNIRLFSRFICRHHGLCGWFPRLCDYFLYSIPTVVPSIVVLLLLCRFLGVLLPRATLRCASIMAFNRHYCLRVSPGLCGCDRFAAESYYHTVTGICHCYFRASLRLCHWDCLRLLPCSLWVPAYLAAHGCCSLHTFTMPLLLWIPWLLSSWCLFASGAHSYGSYLCTRELRARNISGLPFGDWIGLKDY